MINKTQVWASTVSSWILQDQSEKGVADDCILQVDKCSDYAAAESRKRGGMWWIDRVIILLAATMFFLTITAQFCIYLKQL